MSKGIILVDMPDSCDECFALGEIYGKVCKAYDDHFISYGGNYYPNKPDWCPIKPAPEKIKHPSRQSLSQECFADGWNACVDKILGE